MRLGLAVIAASLWLAGLSPALAAPPGPDSPQDDATAVAHAVFKSVDLPTMLSEGIRANFDSASLQMPRPEWNALFRQALVDELPRHMPELEALFGKAIAVRYDSRELHAGAVFLNSPLGQRLLALGMAKFSGRAAPALSPAEIAQVKTASRNPDLEHFMSKFADAVTFPPSLTQDYLALVVPDVFINFGQAAKAAEARRGAAAAP